MAATPFKLSWCVVLVLVISCAQLWSLHQPTARSLLCSDQHSAGAAVSLCADIVAPGNGGFSILLTRTCGSEAEHPNSQVPTERLTCMT